MREVRYRVAEDADVRGMARLRALRSGDEEHWSARIAEYLAGAIHPQHALAPREAYVAVAAETVIGLVAGHLTRRFACDGELQWIDVDPEYRGKGVAAELLRQLAGWFVTRNALRVCVDVEPGNAVARKFYMRQGAVELNPHWLVWRDIQDVLSKS